MQWFEIKLRVPESLKESVANRLFELGAEGVTEGDGPQPYLQGFFDERERAEITKQMNIYLKSLSELFPNLPEVGLEVLNVENENWSENFKQFYQAQKLSPLFFLMPVWDKETQVPDEMIPIYMEAGQAFGTGLHPSTRLCIRLIEDAVELYAKPSQVRCIDVGTGTGILAIVARKVGVQDITAIDIDPIATLTALENFERNECAGIKVSEAPLASFQEPFDLIISNILLETHKELLPHYRRLLKPGGRLILSGLLSHQKAEIDELAGLAGFTNEVAENLQEWTAQGYRLSEE